MMDRRSGVRAGAGSPSGAGAASGGGRGGGGRHRVGHRLAARREHFLESDRQPARRLVLGIDRRARGGRAGRRRGRRSARAPPAPGRRPRSSCADPTSATWRYISSARSTRPNDRARSASSRCSIIDAGSCAAIDRATARSRSRVLSVGSPITRSSSRCRVRPTIGPGFQPNSVMRSEPSTASALQVECRARGQLGRDAALELGERGRRRAGCRTRRCPPHAGGTGRRAHRPRPSR